MRTYDTRAKDAGGIYIINRDSYRLLRTTSMAVNPSDKNIVVLGSEHGFIEVLDLRYVHGRSLYSSKSSEYEGCLHYVCITVSSN